MGFIGASFSLQEEIIINPISHYFPLFVIIFLFVCKLQTMTSLNPERGEFKIPPLFKVVAQLHHLVDYLLVNESNEIKETGCDTNRESSKDIN